MIAWWIWVVAGLVVAIGELVVPAFIFLGFAIGLVGTGLIMAVAMPVFGFDVSLQTGLLIATIIAAAAWGALRAIIGVRHGQSTIITHDINEIVTDGYEQGKSE